MPLSLSPSLKAPVRFHRMAFPGSKSPHWPTFLSLEKVSGGWPSWTQTPRSELLCCSLSSSIGPAFDGDSGIGLSFCFWCTSTSLWKSFSFCGFIYLPWCLSYPWGIWCTLPPPSLTTCPSILSFLRVTSCSLCGWAKSCIPLTLPPCRQFLKPWFLYSSPWLFQIFSENNYRGSSPWGL